MRAFLIAVLVVISGLAQATQDLICRLADATYSSAIAEAYGVRLADTAENAPFVRYEVPPPADPREVQERMRHDSRIIWVEENKGVEMPEHNGAGSGGTIGAVADANAFYRLNANLLEQIEWERPSSSETGQRVLVAVLDTGVSPRHIGLLKKSVARLNAIEPDRPPFDLPMGTDSNGNHIVDEATGHGTMIAGIILSLAPNCRLVMVRAADSDGVGTEWSLIKGLAFAVARGARVANISLGSRQPIPALTRMLEWTERHDLVVVAAAGNNGIRTPFWPAAASEAISVAGVDPYDIRAIFSNWDPTVDACAPATGIRSYWWDGTFGIWSGTSFSSPMVAAGIAAGLELAEDFVSSDDIRRAVTESGDNVDNLNPLYRGQLGSRLNFERLMSRIGD